MRILSYETEPPTHLVFSKDGADNFYVRSDEADARGTFRLVFLVDADAGYFAPALPTGMRYTAATVRRLTPPELAPHLPPAVERAARRSLAELGVDDADAAARRLQQARLLLPRLQGQGPAALDRRHLPRPVQEPGRGLPPPLVRVHDHGQRARPADPLRRERGPRLRRGLVPRARLAAHRPRRRRDAHGRHRRRRQDPAPAARRRPVRQARRLQGQLHPARGRHPRPQPGQLADRKKPLGQGQTPAATTTRRSPATARAPATPTGSAARRRRPTRTRSRRR